MDTTVNPTAHHTPADRRPVARPPYRPLTAAALHLFPGAALLLFVVLAAPTARSLGVPVPFTLFFGIPLVIVPLELGYLALYAKRTTGSFRIRGAVDLRRRLPGRRLAVWAVGLAGWFLVFFLASTLLLDDWVATNLFSWLPETVLQFSSYEDPSGAPTPGPLLTAVTLAVALVFNGVVGPIVEELYFRGHLLPRLEHRGRWAPLINTTLFSLYHFWTPWQNPARIIGFLPIAWVARRERSVQVAMVAHVTINLCFLLLMALMILGQTG